MIQHTLRRTPMIWMLAIILTSLTLSCNNEGGDADTETTDNETMSDAESAMTEMPPLDSIKPATNITDADIEKFLDAVEAVQAVSQQAQSQMMQAVEAEGMTLERFSQIQQIMQNPNADVTPISAEEEGQLDRIDAKMREMEPMLERQSVAAIQETGITPLRYQQLSKGIQMDPELTQKAQSMMQQRMMQQLQEAAGAQQGAPPQGNQQ